MNDFMKAKIQNILDIQEKVNLLTQKSENVVDWGAEIKNLQQNQKRLDDSTKSLTENNN